MADEKVNHLGVICKREYFDLHEECVYDELLGYIYAELPFTYVGKCGPAYRFEAQVENLDGTITSKTAEQDYETAMKKLDAIMNQYVWN